MIDKFNKILIKFIPNKLYFLNVGDIVFCKRYNNNEERDNILLGHREGPYVIIKKTINKTYGIYCTSKLNELRYDNEFINIESNDLRKKTYINTSKIEEINNNRYLRMIGRLKTNELNYIKKVLFVRDKLSLFNNKKLKYNFDVGDIVRKKNNHLYYIYDSDDKFLYLYSIDKPKKCKNPILINNIIYSFNFEGSSCIKKNSKLILVDTTYLNNVIQVKKDKYFKYKLLKDVVKRGDIVKYNNKLYYVYGEEGFNWLVYNVYDKKNKYEIKISNRSYYTEFFSDRISKKEILDIIRSSTDEEMKYIRDLRKKNKLTIRNSLSLKKIVGGYSNVNYLYCLMKINWFNS